MKKYALVPSFQWASTASSFSPFHRPIASSGKLVQIEHEFARMQPIGQGPLAALSPRLRKWDAKLAEYTDFMKAHNGQLPRRKSADPSEKKLADWWRSQVDKLKAGTLSDYQVQRLVEEGLASSV